MGFEKVGERVMLQHGLYEQVVNVALKEALEDIPEARKALAPIDAAEASKVLSQYMTDIIKQGFDNVVDNGGDLDAITTMLIFLPAPSAR